MKKLFLALIMSLISIGVYAADFGDGMTFSNGNATLDFYNYCNKVVYHTNGTNFSHVGEWTDNGKGGRGVVSRNGKRRISEGGKLTVTIYLSNRTVTWTGYVNYSNGKIVSVTLNNQTWYRQ